MYSIFINDYIMATYISILGVSVPPLPHLHRETHHVLLPLSPPDSDDENDGATDAKFSANNRKTNMTMKSPPPLPVTADGIKLHQQV